MKQLLCNTFGHKFSDWQFVPGTSCDQMRVCARCGVKLTRSVPHKFTEWQYVSDQSCMQTRACQQCEKKEEREQHAWIKEGEHQDYCYRRRCARDGRVEERMHEWEYKGESEEILKKEFNNDVEWHYIVQCSNYVCKHCGLIDRRMTGYSNWVEAKRV
jgi:hypothetical protein